MTARPPFPANFPTSPDAQLYTTRRIHEELSQLLAPAQQLVAESAASTIAPRESPREVPPPERQGADEPRALDNCRSCLQFGASRGTLYSLMKAGLLRFVIVGHRREIQQTDTERFLGDDPRGIGKGESMPFSAPSSYYPVITGSRTLGWTTLRFVDHPRADRTRMSKANPQVRSRSGDGSRPRSTSPRKGGVRRVLTPSHHLVTPSHHLGPGIQRGPMPEQK